MSQALYRKYRPRTVDEIVGQKSVITALSNALANDSLSHAYLFTGPRGVGKTSIARIFAHTINSMPYTDDSLPVDIIEIDAASNRGIDEVRDLRDKVRIALAVGPYKIYIIDEVHMLTSHAFNALLKTLEEPPKHVIFILATTESHKLPETILSRTQRYNFKLANPEDTVAHLHKVAEAENITIDNDALLMIASASGGSMRDALSLLDHARHLGETITLEDVRTHIGIPSQESVKKVLSALQDNDPASMFDELDTAISNGVTAVSFAATAITYITQLIQQGSLELPLPVATVLLQGLVEVESSTQQETRLQLALLSALPLTKTPTQPRTTQRPESHTSQTHPATTTNNVDTQLQDLHTTKDLPKSVDTPAEPSRPEQPQNNTTVTLDEEQWSHVLNTIRTSHNTLYSVLRMARVDWSQVPQHILQLEFAFPFHQKRMNDAKNKAIISQTLEDLGITNYSIKCEISAKTTKPNKLENEIAAIPQTGPELQQIRGVFGSAEVLE